MIYTNEEAAMIDGMIARSLAARMSRKMCATHIRPSVVISRRTR